MATLPLPSSELFGGVLVASADAGLREHLVSTLINQRWPVLSAYGGADALGKLESSECDVLLLDQQIPDLDCQELLGLIEAKYPGVEVLQIDSRTRNVVGAPRRWTGGVSDVFQILEKMVGTPKDAPRSNCKSAVQGNDRGGLFPPLPGCIGSSELMQRTSELVRLVAPRGTTVLITGPTGSGKEVIARAIHNLSPRAEKPFVVINCAAIPEALLEAELFGYTRGAFTGAVQSRAGRIHSAQGGTLFLDEIGDLPLGLQSKLLRFLERGEIQRLGSAEVFQVDVRVLAATNANLLEKVEAREFREDLYYRLAVFPIELPSLAERKGDIPELAKHFLRLLDPQQKCTLSPSALKEFEEHSWPGNVRELMHIVERGLILASGAPMIGPEHIYFAPISARRDQQSPRKGPVSA
jgi:DNA-binding NtrC family response regulator